MPEKTEVLTLGLIAYAHWMILAFALPSHMGVVTFEKLAAEGSRPGTAEAKWMSKVDRYGRIHKPINCVVLEKIVAFLLL